MNTALEMLFKDGKRKALTLSYDDGTIHDRKLVEIMNRYGIRGTFNLNSGVFSTVDRKILDGYDTDFTRIDSSEVKDLYAGHEVASHTLTHPSLTDIPSSMGASEVLKDRKNLEELTGQLVRGFAYPYGTYNEVVESVLEDCGIEYARTVCSTEKFEIPSEFLEWHPTCHHGSPMLMELAEKFCSIKTGPAALFYVWGHSYEFSQRDNWDLIEDFFKYITSYKEDIWLATNLEVMDYVKAFKELRCSTDGTVLYNPTGEDLWFESDGKIYCIHGKETMKVSE